MFKSIPQFITYPVLAATVGTLIFQIPFVGPILFIPLSLFAEGFDNTFFSSQFSRTGEHVEIGFAWITLKTLDAWIFYASFFAIVGFLIGLIRYFRLKRRGIQK